MTQKLHNLVIDKPEYMMSILTAHAAAKILVEQKVRISRALAKQFISELHLNSLYKGVRLLEMTTGFVIPVEVEDTFHTCGMNLIEVLLYKSFYPISKCFKEVSLEVQLLEVQSNVSAGERIEFIRSAVEEFNSFWGNKECAKLFHNLSHYSEILGSVTITYTPL